MANRIYVSPATGAKIRAASQDAIGRDMLRRGFRVEKAAKTRISHSPRRVDTGRLRSSVTTVPIRHGGVPGARVGTDVDYALYVHNGTRYMAPNPFLLDAVPAARG